MPDYKYKTSIVIGHRPDGKPIRKYIQDNSKVRFDAKVRQVRALTERGGAPGEGGQRRHRAHAQDIRQAEERLNKEAARWRTMRQYFQRRAQT